MVRIPLQWTSVQFLNLARFRVLAQDFEVLPGISYIVGVIDGSYIPILAHVIGGDTYYCRKPFHYVFLQDIVDTKCVFWNYEFG